jgi:hypothetical protein
MPIVFSEGSGLANTIYGNCQAPIRMFLEQRSEAFDQNSLLKDLFLMGTSENYGDLLATMTAMEGFQPVGENGAYPSDSMQEGFQKMIVYETWKNSFQITQEMIEDAKIMDMRKQPAAFMTSYERTRELFGAAIYAGWMGKKTKIKYRGKEFDISGADGKCIVATDHPAKVKGAVQSNCFSDELSEDALGRAETAMQNFRGDNNEILDVAPSTILIPNDADMKKKVFAIIGADKEPTSANNAFNYQYGRWSVMIWPYLNQFLADGAKPWALLDPTYNVNYGGAVWNDRVPLTVSSKVDDNTDANVWRGRSRFNATGNDWRFICVGGVTGGTALS